MISAVLKQKGDSGILLLAVAELHETRDFSPLLPSTDCTIAKCFGCARFLLGILFITLSFAGMASAQLSATPTGFIFCANENQTCNFGGNQDVAYGANGVFAIKTGILASIPCDNATFGDPAPGLGKACYISPRYAFCANENETCSPEGMQDVGYGANGVFSFKIGIATDLTCDSLTFGDPVPGVLKACYTGGSYASCAAENDVCNLDGMQMLTVAFGANGQFAVKTGVVSSISCDDLRFGDPAPGVVKACYANTISAYQLCASENQICSSDGMQNVAYGANGAFFFKIGTIGDVGCNNATFGDPAPSVVKSCYTSGKYSPQSVTAQVIPSKTQIGAVNVFWPAVKGATAYQVYRSIRLPQGSPTVTRPWKILLSTTNGSATTFTDATVPLFYGISYSVIPNVGGTSPQEQFSQEVRPIGDATAKVWGFADTHTHQFANLGFAGLIFWGQSYGPENQGLADCSVLHNRNFVEGCLLEGCTTIFPVPGIHIPGIANHPGSTGSPDYQFWPRWDTMLHQQMYSDWLYRAYLGGLRLMVMHAVNDEALCQIAKKLWANPNDTLSCNDMDSVDLQLKSARAMESYLNNQCAKADPPRCIASGLGWYHVVTSASEARQTINNGQLAVVLGIEVGQPFGCGQNDGCTKQSVRNSLRHYHDDFGVRHIFPIHLIDNGFGGAQLYNSLFNYDNFAINRKWFDAVECPHTAVPVGGGGGSYAFHLAPIPWFESIAQVTGMGNYPGSSTCSPHGLTDLGTFFIKELMSQHMIIDVDHMSLNSRNDTETIAETYARNSTGQVYPLIAGHTSFLGVLKDASTSENKRSEAVKTDDEILRIYKTGGFVSAGLAEDGTTAQVAQVPGAPLHNCSNSSRTWAQLYQYVVNILNSSQAAQVPAVGLSSDQGLLRLVGPRAGSDGCSGGDPSEPGSQVKWSYPLFTLTPGTHVPMPQSTQGPRTFDFNTDGMAHVGMYPDFIQDLRFIGVNEQALQPLLNSAEAYLEMWEKAERMSVPPPPIPQPKVCGTGEHCCAFDPAGNCTKCVPEGQPCQVRVCPPGQKCCQTDDNGNCTLCVAVAKPCPSPN